MAELKTYRASITVFVDAENEEHAKRLAASEIDSLLFEFGHSCDLGIGWTENRPGIVPLPFIEVFVK
jgi:hypothetical protein